MAPVYKFEFLGYTFRPRLVSKEAGARCHLNLNSDAREASALGLISGHGFGRSFPFSDRMDAVNAVLECGAF